MNPATVQQPAWDAIDPQSLLKPAPLRKMDTGFGYLIRHYWMPAGQLTLSVKMEQKTLNGHLWQTEKRVTRNMLKCDADQCVWRDETEQIAPEIPTWVHFLKPKTRCSICIYHRSRQTYQSYAAHRFSPESDLLSDARNRAFMRQPVLTPLLPVSVGSSWHVCNGEGYMEWTLESARKYGGTTVLFIRRKGKMRFFDLFISGQAFLIPYLIYREGVTAYAWERSLILEDRTYDRFQPFDRGSSPNDIETWTTTRLMLSEKKG